MCLTASYFSGYCSEGGDRDRSMSGDSTGLRFRPSRRMYSQQSTTDQEPVGLSWIPETTATDNTITIIPSEAEETVEETCNVPQEEGFLGVPSKTSVSTSGSADTLIPNTPTSPSNLSSVTLVGSTGSGDKCDETPTDQSLSFQYAPSVPLPERVIPKRPPRTIEQQALTTNTPTVAKIQAPQVVKPIIETRTIEVKPSIIKPAAPTTTTTRALSLTTTVITTSVLTATTSVKSMISPPSIGVTFDRWKSRFFFVEPRKTCFFPSRRPSVGYNAIPHAALCQHRYSLQLSGESAASKVNLFRRVRGKSTHSPSYLSQGHEKMSPRLTHRKFSAPKTPDRQRKSVGSFGTPQREPPR